MENLQPPKQRHSFVTFWLILLIISNSITVIMYLFLPNDLIFKYFKNSTTINIFESILMCFIQIGLIILLLKWKKWAFFGFVIIGIISSILTYLRTYEILVLISLPIAALFLYGVLQIKKNDVSAWKNME